MAFIPVPKTVKCAVVGDLFGQIIVNTLYFAFPADPLASEVAQLAASVGQWAVGELCGVLSQNYTYKRTEAQDISAEGMPAYTDTVGSGTTGTEAFAAAPAGTCIAVSFRTALAGRSYRGRNYVSGISLPSITGNQITTGAETAYRETYENLMSYITDDLPACEHVVVSKYHLGAPRAVGIATPVLSYVVTNRDIDSQRRRLTGRGT